MEIISQGAEAVIELIDGKIHKKRISKSYRHPKLDNKIRIFRTKREQKVMKKLSELGVNVPKLFSSEDEYTIVMEYVDGKRLRDELPMQKDKLILVGEWLAKMHDEGIIHGDLTTSNILLDKKDNLFLIDFGLSFFSQKIEDMAVDIHLLKQAFQSTHYKEADELFEQFLKGYSGAKNLDKIMLQLNEVQLRGKNKH
ncbi:MAG: KEOPS complex kinase/ATPase Bud32 [Candidatus Nanoarchaeia archaeon]|nr:KEOPS complex kinase/ATPase Bud32 [Candidatus Nanoarchaeia archaeon]